MDTVIYSGITVVILIIWYVLQEVVVTPYDIYRKWKSEITYVAPEEFGVLLAKTSRAIRQVEDIFDACGPNTDAGTEAVEVLQQLRKFYTQLKLRRES